MHLKFKLLLIFIVFVFGFLFFSNRLRFEVKAQDCGSDLDCQITQIQKKIDALAPAQENNKKQLAGLNSQIADIKNQISSLSVQLGSLTSKLAKQEKDLAYTKTIFEQKTADQYKFLRTYDPVLPFLSADTAANAMQELILREKVADSDRVSIVDYAKEIGDLNSDKNDLEKNKVGLAAAQANLDKEATFLASEVAKVDSYISNLTSEQQSLISLKSGNFSVSVGDASLADD